MGRPSKFTQEIADEICSRIANGEPLAQICRDEHMPDSSTVRDWQASDERFSLAIAQARDLGADAIAQTARETARGAGDSTGDIQRDKLIVETDLKLLAKWNPKKYGDRVQVDGIEPGNVSITVNAQTIPALQAGYKEFREALAHGRN